MSEIAEALDRVMNRLDAIEAKVDALSEAPSAASGLQMSRDHSESIERLLQRLDEVETTLDLASTFAKRAPLLADAAGDGVAFVYNEAMARGIDPIERGTAAIALMEQVSDPAMMALVGRLVSHRDSLECLVNMLDGLSSEDLQVLSSEGGAAATRIAGLMRTADYQQLVSLIDARTAGVMGSAGTAMVEVGAVEAVGPIGALLAIRDPDVGKALGFALAVAKRFGQRL